MIHLQSQICFFYFVTQCYSEYMESVVDELAAQPDFCPDMVIMTSCLWDMTRYGHNSRREYHDNIRYDAVTS